MNDVKKLPSTVRRQFGSDPVPSCLCAAEEEALERGDNGRPALVDLIDVPRSGTLNVAGTEPLSRHDFASLLLRHFAVPGTERIEQASSAALQAAGAPPRALDVRLDVSRAEALLGWSLPGVRELLGET